MNLMFYKYVQDAQEKGMVHIFILMTMACIDYKTT